MAESIERRIIRRLARFLKHSPGRTVAQGEPIRATVVEVLRRSTSRRWNTYVVGGAVRDLLLGPRGSWPRDVDVIVEGCSEHELEDAFGDILVRRNSFGGLHLRRTVGIGRPAAVNYELLFDVWRLQDTWGIKTRGLAPTISSFLTTPFLNIDSIAVVLPDDIRQLTVYENGFSEAVVTRTLEINSELNPFPFVCAVRSLILAAKLDFWLGPRLASFIHTLMKSASVTELMKAQISHYGQIRCQEDDIKGWISNMRVQLEVGPQKVRLLSTPQRQTHLWRDWPPRTDSREEESGAKRQSLAS